MEPILTNGEKLPSLVSFELREGEPVGYFHGVLILGSHGQHHQKRMKYANGHGYPDTFAFHDYSGRANRGS